MARQAGLLIPYFQFQLLKTFKGDPLLSGSQSSKLFSGEIAADEKRHRLGWYQELDYSIGCSWTGVGILWF